jgi:hypothetical protein
MKLTRNRNTNLVSLILTVKLLLGSARVVILSFKPYGTHDHILLYESSRRLQTKFPVFLVQALVNHLMWGLRTTRSWDSDWAKRWTTEEGQDIFLVSRKSRSALGPAQSPMQRILDTTSPGVKRQGLEADSLPPSCAELHYHSPN